MSKADRTKPATVAFEREDSPTVHLRAADDRHFLVDESLGAPLLTCGSQSRRRSPKRWVVDGQSASVA